MSIVLVENKRVEKLIWGVGVLTVGLFWILKLVFYLRLLLYLGYYSINGWDFLVVILKLGRITENTCNRSDTLYSFTTNTLNL